MASPTTLRKLIASLTIASFFLASCATTGNRVLATGKSKDLTENGVALLNFDRGIMTGSRAFELLISPINPSTGMIHASTPEGIYTAARAIAGVTNPNWPQDKYWALTLVPGEYAISKIRQLPTPNHTPTYTSSAFQGTSVPQGAGIAGIVILGALLAVAGGMAIAEAVKENKRTDKDRLNNPNGQVIFIDAEAENRPTPRFRVEAGKVTYIGDILIDLEDRIVDAVNDNGQESANDNSAEPARKIVEKRVFVIYDSDEEKAKDYARKIGLGSAPWAHAHLSALADHEVNITIVRSGEDFDEPAVTAPVEQGSKKVPTTVEPQQPIEVTTTPTSQAPVAKTAEKTDAQQTSPTPQAPAAKTVGKMNLRQLMKAFLSGDITESEYDAKRKALK
jgi:hypothetical protein